ncbi:MAG TPA: septal ring lytic transglycosylase RlpA family protein [Solirubrobacterales bacterium]
MKAGRNRHGRKDHSRYGHARSGGSGRRLRRTALGAAIMAMLLGAVPAQAGTGGAGVAASDGTVPGGQGIVFSAPMRSAGATWYGPGLYGNHTACGQTLWPGTVGVAHKTLPCGTTLKFAYHGHYLVTRVIDRGPYTEGNAFDLTNGARRALGFEGVDRVRYAIALRHARNR